MKKKVFRERYGVEVKTPVEEAIEEIIEEIKEEPVKVEEPKKKGRRKSAK